MPCVDISTVYVYAIPCLLCKRFCVSNYHLFDSKQILFWKFQGFFFAFNLCNHCKCRPKVDGVLRNVSDGTMEAYMIPPFASNHASFIEPLPNGDLVMAWFSGTSEGESNVAIVFSHLKNNSDQWSKAQVVSQRKGYSNQNPVLFHDNKTDVLYLFHSQQEAKTASAGIQSEGWPLYIS